MIRPKITPQAGPVLTRAVLRAAERLGFSHRELSRVLGVSTASLSRMGKTRSIEPESKEGELALLFVRVFRSLDALVGGDEGSAGRWFRAENSHLRGVPAELVGTVTGLVQVVEYLDAVRGKL